MSRFRRLFGKRWPIIGLIHLPPLPDYPDTPGIDAIVAGALADLGVLMDQGVDGVLVENEYDRPHRVLATPATVDAMHEITRAVVTASRNIVVGCEILLNDPQASLQVAAEAGARFIRTDFFVDRMSRPGYGEFVIDPAGVIAHRSAIGADQVLIFADIQVKYATLLDTRTLAESARLACAHGADAVVVTGGATGNAPARQQLEESVSGASVPVLIGSGLDAGNTPDLLPASGGAIVGTALMRDRRVDAAMTAQLMAEVENVRGR